MGPVEAIELLRKVKLNGEKEGKQGVHCGEKTQLALDLAIIALLREIKSDG